MANYLPQPAIHDVEVALTTFQDAVEHVLDLWAIDRAADMNLRRVRRAVQIAYREFSQTHRWNYYERVASINTVATQTTGTVAYLHTGGTYERQLTLAGATWPTNARVYRIILGDSHYDIEAYKTSTVLTLSQTNNPGVDVASGATYTLYRRAYSLPPGFRKLHGVTDVSQPHQLPVVPSSERYFGKAGFFDTPGVPEVCTVRNEGLDLGGLSLVFAPPPNTALNYELLYESEPRRLLTEKESSGTVTTNATTAVTGSSSAFAAAHVGAVIRFSSSTTVEPTGLSGAPPTDDLGGTGTYQVYSYQRVILAVASTTSLTVDAAVPALSGVEYVISDPLDIKTDSMLTAFLRAVEAEYARMASLKGWEDAAKVARQALIVAMENDGVTPYPTRWTGTTWIEPVVTTE